MPCRPSWAVLLAAAVAGLGAPDAAQRLRHMARVEGRSMEDLVTAWVLLRHAALPRSGGRGTSPANVLPFTPDAASRASLLPLKPLKPLKEVSQRRGNLLVTWTTGGDFAQMALNLALSVRVNVPQLEGSLVVICLDQDAQRQLEGEGFLTVLLPGPSDANAVKDPWQNDDLWKFKYRLMASLMTLEISALVLDTDVVLLSDPFVHLGGDSDLEVMTDLFFPKSQLLDVALRPEDHFNTGYVFHRATASALRLMMAFLDAFDSKEWKGFKRDWFNQRAFNKLVLEWVNAGHIKVLYADAAWCALRGHGSANAGAVARTASRSCHQRPLTGENISIRVLNPAVIAHGMNYFWRRAHLMPGETGGKSLAAVHANGVEPKDYFLRDRGLWYLDDFEERFGEPRFFTYVHPEGLSLAEDFDELAAALEVAMMLRRRVVLPNTMNCRNCPAYEPYGFAQWSSEDLHRGCTFDYFSRASLAMGEYLQFTAESGVLRLPKFQALPRRSILSVQQLLEDFRAAGGRSPAELWRSPVVELGEGVGIRTARDLLKRAVGGQPLDSLPCGWRPWPATTYACRDAWLPASKKGAPPCDGSAQAECGILPFMCCEAYFGWAEKLELLGGRPWDLPCGCGLAHHCEARHLPDQMQACCSPKEPTARKRYGETCSRNLPVGALPRLVPDDSDTYSSSILRELAKGQLARQDARGLCLISAALHRGMVGDEADDYCEELIERFLAAQRS